MEEANSNPNPMTSPEVGFPHSSANKPKSKTSLVIFIILGLLLIAGAVIFFVSKNRDSAEESPTPSSFLEESTPFPTPSESASPSAKPADKAAVKIQVLNGTGIPGEAAYLQGILKNLGYTNITAGNGTTSDAVATEVVFSSTFPKDLASEIEKKLDTIYSSVDTSTLSSLKAFDVQITTGLRKGSTAKPSATASPKASASASPKPSTSPTSSTTPTPTPTQ